MLQILFLWSATFFAVVVQFFSLISGQTQPRVKKKGEGTGPKKKASIKRKCKPPGSEKKKKAELAWKTKMSNITPILLAAQLTKPGKFSGVPLVRKFLIQKKKLS